MHRAGIERALSSAAACARYLDPLISQLSELELDLTLRPSPEIELATESQSAPGSHYRPLVARWVVLTLLGIENGFALGTTQTTAG